MPPLPGDGGGGVSVGSFFASRVLYSEFLLLVLILLICIPEGSDGLYFSSSRAFRPYTLALVVMMLVLTFSRKEILIGAVILITHYGNFSRIRPAWAAKSAMAIMFLLAFVVFFIAFMDLMLQNFSEGYVRFKIFMAAWDIFSSHFPLGSGPGTFGTAMSKSYTDVYLEFQVPTAVTGTSGEFDGPIFDLFFISFFAEYGLGAFLIFWLFVHPFRTTPTEVLTNIVDGHAAAALPAPSPDAGVAMDEVARAYPTVVDLANVRGTLVGGADDLRRLIDNGELSTLLKA